MIAARSASASRCSSATEWARASASRSVTTVARTSSRSRSISTALPGGACARSGSLTAARSAATSASTLSSRDSRRLFLNSPCAVRYAWMLDASTSQTNLVPRRSRRPSRSPRSSSERTVGAVVPSRRAASPVMTVSATSEKILPCLFTPARDCEPKQKRKQKKVPAAAIATRRSGPSSARQSSYSAATRLRPPIRAWSRTAGSSHPCATPMAGRSFGLSATPRSDSREPRFSSPRVVSVFGGGATT